MPALRTRKSILLYLLIVNVMSDLHTSGEVRSPWKVYICELPFWLHYYFTYCSLFSSRPVSTILVPFVDMFKASYLPSPLLAPVITTTDPSFVREIVRLRSGNADLLPICLYKKIY